MLGLLGSIVQSPMGATMAVTPLFFHTVGFWELCNVTEWRWRQMQVQIIYVKCKQSNQNHENSTINMNCGYEARDIKIISDTVAHTHDNKHLQLQQKLDSATMKTRA